MIYRHWALSAIMVLSFLSINAQDESSLNDSATVLQEVVVKGFAQNRRMIEVPASVSTIGVRQINRFPNISIAPVFNAQAGTRLEERSPGSYRLNIRGSSLRSPFGVRNVKVYYNDVPYTDPGGNTYLSMIGFYSINNVEIWKGPASSMYGAGTGGVVLMETTTSSANHVRADISAGSFNTIHYQLKARLGDSSMQHQLSYQQLRSDGYREHTNSDRKVFTWDASAKAGRAGKLNTHFMYGDLYYQTPGALNDTQYALNRRAARPAAGMFPSAAANLSAFNIRSFIAGINYIHQVAEHWNISSTVYGAYSKVVNPTIRNYEIRNEPHGGGRLVSTMNGGTQVKWKWSVGAELQQGNSTIRIADNNAGRPASLQTEDEADQLQYFIFTQWNVSTPGGWSLDAGMSWNKSTISIRRLSELPVTKQSRTYRNEVAPRVSFQKMFGANNNIYATISRGFSPPTTAEILPSTGEISTGLEAESGINYEIGWKASMAERRIFVNIAGYYFNLNNTIAQRRDSAGADYFENAGKTKQLGVEAELEFRMIQRSYGFVRALTGWSAYTLNKFTYEDYVKEDENLSGKKLPGIAPNVVAAGIDMETSFGLYSNITFYHSDRMYLNDANSVRGDAYDLVTAKVGIKRKVSRRLSVNISGVVENLFDEEYVSGYDINAAAGRYYNASAGRNVLITATAILAL